MVRGGRGVIGNRADANGNSTKSFKTVSLQTRPQKTFLSVYSDKM